MIEADIVIVGAGSAGSVLAARLSEDPTCKVLLLEAGTRNVHPLVSMPRGWVMLTRHKDFAWQFPVTPEAGRPCPEVWTRGRGLGGSSSINGQIWCRGAPQDYDSWSALGAEGWSADVMARAFDAIENRQDGQGDDVSLWNKSTSPNNNAPENRVGSSAKATRRSPKGRISITQHPLRSPLGEALLRSGEELGLPRRPVLYGAGEEAIGPYSHNISTNGVRSSASRAFLSPIRKRANLRILTGVAVERVLFDGFQARGVVARHHGQKVTIHARAGVILSAGALKSPQILQLSGIGPASDLQAAGISVLRDISAVGAGLAEHLVLALPYRLMGTGGHNLSLRGLGLIGHVLRWGLTGGGLMGYGGSETGAFMRSRADVAWPDLQLAISPYSFAQNLLAGKLQLDRQAGITATGYMLRPTSRGRIALASPDPSAAPKITANWLATEHDRTTLLAMIGLLRRLMSNPAMRAFTGEEIWPGAALVAPEALLDAARGRFVSGLHATGSCAMGQVLDGRLRVKGVDGLWVVDAAAIPAPVSGNTNGPVSALAWRAAELIREDMKKALL